MAVDLTDEIVQDFLVEAGEILEQLGGQLVDLEQMPDNRELLNAVFRGFHTIKGGAGFIGLDALVEVSHKAEDLFDLLRKGARTISPSLMDVILQVLDVLNSMFDSLRAGMDPDRAPELLLQALGVLARNEDLPAAAPAVITPKSDSAAADQDPVLAPESDTPEGQNGQDSEAFDSVPTEAGTEAVDGGFDNADGGTPPSPATELAPTASGDDITEAEFEALLDQMDAQKKTVAHAAAEVTAAIGGDEITEAEFDALLDELEARKATTNIDAGAYTGTAEANSTPETKVPETKVSEAELSEIGASESGPAAVSVDSKTSEAPEPVAIPSAGATDDITEAEFDALLDQLHGQKSNTSLKQIHRSEPERPAAPGAHAAPARNAEPVTETTRSVVASRPQKAAPPQSNQADSTVRVETSVLDRIMNMVGELVLIRNRFSTLEASIGNEEMTKTASILDVVTSDLQAAVMKTRMQPVKKVFGRFPRVVRDLARSLNKEVNLELRGEETDLDKNLVEALADPLVHLVRNAVDHGIEMPGVRLAAGKPAAGTVTLSAAQEGDHILLTIADDGGGMDPEVLRRKAVEKGVMDEDAAARLDEQACFELIFAAGFSTKSEISDISGRGVGMDVVKTRINQLNGIIQVKSSIGKGTSISVKLPLTLAIVPTLMVVLGTQIFALPLVNVNEIIDYDEDRINVVDGRDIMVVRGRALPLFQLSQWLVRDARYSPKMAGHVVIVTIGTAKFGLIVDQLIGQEEVVIKPLGAMLHGTKGLAGATITGDGRIALILDLPGLIAAYGHR